MHSGMTMSFKMSLATLLIVAAGLLLEGPQRFRWQFGAVFS